MFFRSLARLLPAPCRRHAAGRVEADVPSHLQPAARLQMSWHGRHACCLRPCGHCSHRLQRKGRVWHRCLTIHRAAAELFAKAASELVSIVFRRVRRLSASLHRYRARTRFWCNGDRMAKRRRVTAKPLVSNVGTFSLKPFRCHRSAAEGGALSAVRCGPGGQLTNHSFLIRCTVFV